VIGYLKRLQKCTSTSSKQRWSTQDQKVARSEQPIIAVKNAIQPRKKASNDDDNVQWTKASTKKDNEPVADKKKDYVICHVSFQSTGGTNITSVNALSSVELYVREQNKGKGNQKRTWGIEMNEAPETYLKTYSAVDKIDQMLLGWDVDRHGDGGKHPRDMQKLLQ
jgi:hypothetical protein